MATSDKVAMRSEVSSNDSIDAILPPALVGIASRIHTMGAIVVEKVTSMGFSPLERYVASADGQGHQVHSTATETSDAIKTNDPGNNNNNNNTETGDLNSTMLVLESNDDGYVSVHQNNQPNGIGGVCLVM